ncbi:uncharacterized protein LOC120897813 [Anopheles arabiensis]|uniref:uncharacterized protein LOC120897813 n=1 Tax=Anopheles arabiensis TaxID=7173 RepID=UPI001AADB1A4|nr:uncharacterized protein LOC120897813 [Anopheles arabiensis]
MLLRAVGLLLLSSLVARLDGRFLEVSKPPPGTVAIVPTEDDGESVLHGPLFHDLQQLDREKASEMISVKLFNQFHSRTFDDADELEGNGSRELDADRPLPEARDTVDDRRNEFGMGYVHPVPPVGPIDAIELKGNGIEQDLALPDPIADVRLLDGWAQPDSREASEHRLAEDSPIVEARQGKGNSLTTTTTTTSTTTRTTTVRKVRRRKTRQQTSTSSSPRPPSTTRRTARTTAPSSSRLTTTSTTSHRPPRPKLDITRLNLDHLEDDLLLSYASRASPQALALAAGTIPPPVRLLPRSIRQEEAEPKAVPVPSCGCQRQYRPQHSKRSLANHIYSSEEAIDRRGDYDEYDDYEDYGELKLPPAPARPLLLPAMSRLLAAPAVGSGEHPESSVERAEKVHGTLERLMGIVTIFSHVDEFIQRKTKQSIRRLARLYESEELD